MLSFGWFSGLCSSLVKPTVVVSPCHGNGERCAPLFLNAPAALSRSGKTSPLAVQRRVVHFIAVTQGVHASAAVVVEVDGARRALLRLSEDLGRLLLGRAMPDLTQAVQHL